MSADHSTASGPLRDVLVCVAEDLLTATNLRELYRRILDGLQNLRFPSAMLFCVRRNQDTNVVELIRTARQGLTASDGHLRELPPEDPLVITAGAPFYREHTRCVLTERITIFSHQADSAVEAYSSRAVEVLPYVPPPWESSTCRTVHTRLPQQMASDRIDIPFVVSGRPRATVSIDSPIGSDHFKDREIQVLEHLKRFAEVAIDLVESKNCDLVVRDAEQALDDALGSGGSVLGAVYGSLIRNIVEQSGADGGHIRLFSTERKKLVRVASYNDEDELWPPEKSPGEALSGIVYESRTPVVCDNVHDDALAAEIQSSLRRSEHALNQLDARRYDQYFSREGSFACLPFQYGQACEGTVSLTSSRPYAFAPQYGLTLRIIAAVASRIPAWRGVSRMRLMQQQSSLVEQVTHLLDQQHTYPLKRLRTIAVALTSGHGFGYNTSLLFLRHPSSDLIECISVVGFATHEDATREWSGLVPPDFCGSLHRDIEDYLQHADAIESRPFQQERLACRFHLSQAGSAWMKLFSLPDDDDSWKALEHKEFPQWHTGTVFDETMQSSGCILPVRFSGQTIAVLYLDDRYTLRIPWKDLEHKEQLLHFCERIIAPTLLYDRYASKVVQEERRGFSSLLPHGVFLIDRSGIIRQSDAGFRQIMAGDNRGRSVFELPTIRETAIGKGLTKALSGKRNAQKAIRFQSLSGRRTEIDAVFSPLYMNSNEAIGVIGILLDADDLRSAAKTTLAELVLGESHSISRGFRALGQDVSELRNKLAHGNTSGFEQNLLSFSDRIDAIGEVWHRIREYEIAASGMHIEPISLAPIIDDSTRRIRRLFSVSIEVEESDPSPSALCDRRFLSLMLDNLLLNACQAARESEVPRVSVCVRSVGMDRQDAFARIVVKNNGSAIPQGAYRTFGCGGTRTDGRGVGGFGFRLVRELAASFGGRVHVLESSLEAGTSIALEIPTQ